MPEIKYVILAYILIKKYYYHTSKLKYCNQWSNGKEKAQYFFS